MESENNFYKKMWIKFRNSLKVDKFYVKMTLLTPTIQKRVALRSSEVRNPKKVRFQFFEK